MLIKEEGNGENVKKTSYYSIFDVSNCLWESSKLGMQKDLRGKVQQVDIYTTLDNILVHLIRMILELY